MFFIPAPLWYDIRCLKATFNPNKQKIICATDMSMRWKMECSIQQGKAKLNRIFHLSPNENICNIARMKNIHYFIYNIKDIFDHLECLINI